VNSIDLLLLDFVQIAEAPVYTSYRWLGRQLGRDLPMVEFLSLLGRLVEEDAVRLWEVGVTSHQRALLSSVPSNLEQRYANVPDLDARFDPFGLSLTLGPAADLTTEPEWSVELEFGEAARFVVSAKPEAVEHAKQQVARLFPDVAFVEMERSTVGDRVLVAGRIEKDPLEPAGA
jgi:hypothetical protein